MYIHVFDPESRRDFSSISPTDLHLHPVLGLRSSLPAMTTTEKFDLDSLAGSDPKKPESIYKSILQGVFVFHVSVEM